MKLITALAADYWIDNTDRIYKENLHVSTPVMEAYIAGFKEAVRRAATRGRIAQLQDKEVDLAVTDLYHDEE